MKGRSATSVSPKNRLILWTRAAGRCQYAGCNESLLGDLISGKEALNKAYIAHIVAAAPDGPRGDPRLSHKLANEISNLMLLCHTHHKLIDDDETAPDHPVSRLMEMKRRHEDRIAVVTAIDDDRGTHLIHYAARIGEHDCPISLEATRAAVLPDRYPLDRPISLEVVDSSYEDHEQAYWDHQVETLRRQFAVRVGERLALGEVRHASLFALAPQPLLMELGRLISDIADVDVRQLAREPKGWAWRPDRDEINFHFAASDRGGEDVALVLGVSAAIADERIERVLPGAPIWRIGAARPGNDVLARVSCLANFRTLARRAFAEIAACHGPNVRIHVFPALPVSMAVEVGRVWMPKADPPLIVYDERRDHSGFVARMYFGARRSPVSRA